MKFHDNVDVRHKNVQQIHWLSFKYLKFIHIHVFVTKVNVTQVLHTY